MQKLKFTFDWIQFSVYQTLKTDNKPNTLVLADSMDVELLDSPSWNSTVARSIKIESTGQPVDVQEWIITSNEKYNVIDTEKKIANFRKLYEIYSTKEPEICVATIEANPRVSFIDPRLCVVKLSNNVCYAAGVFGIVCDILEAFSFEFVNYTRLDICTDNNSLCGIDPQVICAGIASNEYMLKANKKERIHQTNEKAISQDWGQKTQIHKVKTKYSGITFGSRSSEVHVNFYDKTKEMLQKTDKPWIKSWWDNQDEINQDLPVWRLEFSFKSNSKRVFKIGGKAYTYKSPELITYIDNLASYGLAKHFYLVKYNPQHDKHIERMEKVFDFKIEYFPIFLDTRQKSNTMVKAYFKKRWESMLKRKKLIGKASREIYNEFITDLNNYNLYKWFHDRVSSINLYFNELTDTFLEEIEAPSFMKHLNISAIESAWNCDLTGEMSLLKVDPERFFKYLNYVNKQSSNIDR